MDNALLTVPRGSGKHPIQLIAISARDLLASTTFYATLFHWRMHSPSADFTVAVAPAGPVIVLHSGPQEELPGMVPMIGVDDVDKALTQVAAVGCSVERVAPTIPMIGKFGLFKDASGTIYGVTDAQAPNGTPPMPMPMGENPKPPIGSICSVEMYAASGAAAADFFGKQFGWGTRETMPQYMAFDPGAGVPGVFQSHTVNLSALAYIYVNDVGATLNAIESVGGKRSAEPMSAPGMATFGYFKDSSGINMGLIGPA